jgi:DNA-binding winged helix-turn-helix (wHTH) protein
MGGKIHFGVYELDCDAMELRKHGVLIRLQEQPFRVLAALVERPGETVTREELRERIWGNDTFVDFEQSLNKAVNRVREALHDDAARPQYVETIPRRGYRFVAPVTRIEPQRSVGPSSSPSNSQPRESQSRSLWLGKTAALVVTLVLVFVGVIATVWLKRLNPHAVREVRHITFSGYRAALSRDGKLLAYTSNVGGDVPHIWVRQTAGGEAVQVTKGPDMDNAADFSPDGTRIAFFSARERGGIYIAPTLPGEPTIVVSGIEAAYPRSSLSGHEAINPRFSPSGNEILFWHDGKAFMVSVDGGHPVPLAVNQDFLLDYALWAPSGKAIIFYGARIREPDKPDSWWIASLNGLELRLARLPELEQDDDRIRSHRVLAERIPSVRAWTRTKDGREWIVYSVSRGDTWKLLRVEAYDSGEVDAKPQQLASGTGDLGSGGSFSEDGKLAFTVLTSGTSIYEIDTNESGQKVGPTKELSLSQERNDRSPSVSRDGH